MPKLPQLKSQEIISVLLKLGFEEKRIRGSHVRLYHKDGRRVTIPQHNRPVFIGTFNSILRQACISKEQFLEQYKKK